MMLGLTVSPHARILPCVLGAQTRGKYSSSFKLIAVMLQKGPNPLQITCFGRKGRVERGVTMIYYGSLFVIN